MTKKLIMISGQNRCFPKITKCLSITASALAVLAALPAMAEPIQVDFDSGIIGTYTDNSRLSAVTREEAYIVSGSAGVNLHGDKGRVHINNVYSLAYDYYTSDGLDDLSGFRHSLTSQNVLEVMPDTFFLDLNASIGESGGNRGAVNPATSRTVTGNRVQRRTIQIRPHYELDVYNGILSTGGISYGRVKYVNPDVGTFTNPGFDRTDHEFRGELALFTDPQDSTLSWRVDGTAEKDDNDLERYTGRGSLFYEVSSDLQLIARTGYESSNRDASVIRDVDGVFWSFGFNYRFGPRSGLRAEVGERFDNANYEFEAYYNLSEFIGFTAGFEQGIRTDQQSALRDVTNTIFDDFGIPRRAPGGTLDLVVDSYLYDQATLSARFGTQQAFLRVEGSYLRRDFLTIDRDEEVYTGSVSGQMPLNERSFLRANYRISDQTSQSIFDEIDIHSGSVELAYQLLETATLSARYAYRRQEYAIGPEIEENAAVLQISKTW